jgi:hypothetical protein
VRAELRWGARSIPTWSTALVKFLMENPIEKRGARNDEDRSQQSFADKRRRLEEKKAQRQNREEGGRYRDERRHRDEPNRYGNEHDDRGSGRRESEQCYKYNGGESCHRDCVRIHSCMMCGKLSCKLTECRENKEKWSVKECIKNHRGDPARR